MKKLNEEIKIFCTLVIGTAEPGYVKVKIAEKLLAGLLDPKRIVLKKKSSKTCYNKY
jgi:hypothetical protein